MISPKTPLPHMAFTVRYKGKSSALMGDVQIFPAFTPPAYLSGQTYRALYDTGATHSTVSPRVVQELGLVSVGVTNVGVGGGSVTTTNHLVNIGLPNRVLFSMFRVAMLSVNRGIDVIVGMDVLGLGDFTVTNHEGNTTFSFCCPSRREIDFVAEVADSGKVITVKSEKISRNSLCPCGSKKKYKFCHGNSSTHL